MATRRPGLPSVRVERHLRKRLIDDGEWDHGEPLPPAAELAREYQVSSGTIAKVMKRLEQAGLVTVYPRYGVFRGHFAQDEPFPS